jgi:hypothetical protein
MLHELANGDKKLSITILICFAALVIVVLVSVVRYGLPGSVPPPRFEVDNGALLGPQAGRGEDITIDYRICNRSGSEGTALMFAAWVNEEGVLQEDAMQGANLSQLRLGEGCENVIIERTTPSTAGRWRRAGFLITVFDVGRPELNAISSDVVEVR